MSRPLCWVLIQSGPLKPDFESFRSRLTAWMITAPTKRMGKAVVFCFFQFFSLALAPRPLVHMLGRAGGSSIGSSASCALGSRGSIIILPLCSLPSDGFEPRLYSVCLFAFVRSCLFVIPPPLLPSLAPTLPPLPTFGRPHRV